MAPHVAITGASSGIGAALARRYAAEGARLSLLARDDERLARIAEACRVTGAPEAVTASIDVRDGDALRGWLSERDRTSPIDVLIANAGVTGGTDASGKLEGAEDSLALWDINVLGTVRTIQSVLPEMVARGRGQIAVMSSLAAFVPLPDAPSYSGSKAALLAYGLALRKALRPAGVRLSVICPGYVDTPMSRRLSGEKPAQIDSAGAAEAILHGLRKDVRIIAFPQPLAAVTRAIGCLPACVVQRLAPRFHVRAADAV